MIIRNRASSSARQFKTADNRLTGHSQWSTAHLIEPQPLFLLVKKRIIRLLKYINRSEQGFTC